MLVAGVVALSTTVTIAAGWPGRTTPPASRSPERFAATTTTTPTVQRSPFADGASDQDALLSTQQPASEVRPVGLAVVRLGLLATVTPVGPDPNGGVAVPPDSDTAGWYQFGAAPGSVGSTVIVGHINLAGRRGVFATLADAQPGDAIDLTMSDGSSRRYVVTQRQQYLKQQAPLDELFRTDGPERLVLITCGGGLDRARHSYEDNVVVTASPSS